VINLELALADLGQVEKRVERLRKQAKNSKEAAEELAILEKILICLNDGISALKSGFKQRGRRVN
jgi:ribosome-binding ATPase YchF (GTP1/OBG family)